MTFKLLYSGKKIVYLYEKEIQYWNLINLKNWKQYQVSSFQTVQPIPFKCPLDKNIMHQI